MQYVTLTVPQHVYEQLGLHPNKTLVLKRSENISGIDTHGNNVSTSKSAEASSHCDEALWTMPEIDDACEEIESSLQTQGGASQGIHGYPDHAGNRDVRINYPRACGKCNQKFFTASSYLGHLERCRFMPRIQKASYPDGSSGLNMIPEAFHALGYDAPVLTEPEINDTPEQNESSKIIGGGIDRERCLRSTDDFDMIPEALHALSYDTPILSEPEIDDVTEENDSSLQKVCGTSRVFLNPINIDDAEEAIYQRIKTVFPRPCPVCEKVCNSKSTYYQHRKICLSTQGASRKNKVPNFYDPFLTNAELRFLGYDITVVGGKEYFFQMRDGVSEGKDSNPSDADEGIERSTYPRPCPVCDKMCNSTSMFFKHRTRCRAVEIPKDSSVIRYYDYGSSSDSSEHMDATPEELSALGGDPPVLPESEINESNEGTSNRSSSEGRNALQGTRRNALGVVRFRRTLYPRVCANCRRKYKCKASFYHHKRNCAAYVAKRNGTSSSGIHNITFEGRSVSFVYLPEHGTKQMDEGEASNAGNNLKPSCRMFCLSCRRSYSSTFGFKRHLKSCGHARISSIKGIGDYVLPRSARIYREPRQDKLMDASEKEDKPVNWVPLTTKPTNVLKYFVANKNSSSES